MDMGIRNHVLGVRSIFGTLPEGESGMNFLFDYFRPFD